MTSIDRSSIVAKPAGQILWETNLEVKKYRFVSSENIATGGFSTQRGPFDKGTVAVIIHRRRGHTWVESRWHLRPMALTLMKPTQQTQSAHLGDECCAWHFLEWFTMVNGWLMRANGFLMGNG